MASLAEVDHVAGGVRYVDSYLNTQSYHVCKYIMSAGWVFPGSVGFSQWFKKEFGDCPPREMLVELGKMAGEEREEHTWFALYLRDRKCTKGRN
jgi:hypothetical protein